MLFIERSDRPFIPGVDHVPESGTPDRINLTRLIAAIGQLGAARGGSIAPIDWPKQAGDAITAEETAQIAAILQGLVSHTTTTEGKLVVRYLGDLKPSTYPLDAEFFHLTDSSTQNEIGEMLRSAAVSGRQEVDFINLQNVRDIKLQMNSSKVIDIHAEVKIVHEAGLTMGEWAAANCGSYVREAN